MNSFDDYVVPDKGIGQTELRQALLGKQFMMYYQPIVDTETGKVASVEALIRWNHPEFGIVPPANFIKRSEETGYIIPIGKWVIRKVCGQLAIWRKRGIPLIPVSINISAQQLSQEDFIHEVREVLSYYQLEGRLLTFEISETSLMKNEGVILETFKELQQLGIHIYIDHFGTGHSSLSYLTSFQLDGIKIDRSFIHDITKNPENAVITTALIHICRNLKIHVIAEGVETDEEWQYLKNLKCDQLQGFLFGKPCSVEEFEQILMKGVSFAQSALTNADKSTYQIQIHSPIHSEIVLIDYLKEEENEEETKVLIENIGPGGLRFSSNLKLVVGQELIYSFKPENQEENIQVAGVVLWNDELSDGQYQYGVHFIIPDHQRTNLTQLLRDAGTGRAAGHSS